MFERAISQTIQRISRDTLNERPMVSLQEIYESEHIPDRLKPFFETEVQWWLHNERIARETNKRFNYSHPELASLIAYLEQVQARHAQFEREEFLSVLDSAVKLTFNYLCRPQTTLKWYIFRGEPVRPLSEVLLRFNAFTDYDYFRTVFQDWVDRKRAERPSFDAISSQEFERVVRRTDDQILLNCTIEDLLEIMQPLFEFLGEGPRSVVPVDALVVFFDDKNIKRLVDPLETYREGQSDSISREDFVSILEDLLNSADEEAEADFSAVFQNDALDQVVREHLEATGRTGESQLIVTSPDRSSDQHEAPDSREILVSASSIHTPAHTTDASTGGSVVTDRDVTRVDAVHDDLQDDDPDAWLDDDDLTPVPSATEDYADDDEEEFVAEDDDLTSPDDIDLELDDEVIAVGAATYPRDVVAEDDNRDRRDTSAALPLRGNQSHEGSDVPIVPIAVDSSDLVKPTDAGDFSNTSVRPGPVEPPPAGSGRGGAFLDPALERKVIKKIFGNNGDAYQQAIHRIAEAADWKAACQVLDEIFISHDVDPYSRTAIRFTDSVYGRYIPRPR